MNNLVNRKFGRLFVLYRTNDYISPNGKHLIKWHCKCDCGNEITKELLNCISNK